MKLKRYQSGFTLIELLVIISIIGFLVAAVMLYLAQARSKSRDAKRVADVKQISSGLDLYYSHCNSYPIETNAELGTAGYTTLYTGTGNALTGPCGVHNGSSTQNGGFGTNTTGTIIIRTILPAPTPADGATCPTGNNNSYLYNSTGPSYTLRFCLGEDTAGYPEGLNTLTR